MVKKIIEKSISEQLIDCMKNLYSNKPIMEVVLDMRNCMRLLVQCELERRDVKLKRNEGLEKIIDKYLKDRDEIDKKPTTLVKKKNGK